MRERPDQGDRRDRPAAAQRGGLLTVGAWDPDVRPEPRHLAGRRRAAHAAAPAPLDPPARLGHIEALDGLRAVAVVAVLLFHGGVRWLPGGFLGVDVFFVLSGFLITTLLLAEVDRTGAVSLGTFWARRVRRLLPALLVVVAAVVGFAGLIAPDRPAGSLRIDAGAALAYVANWRFVLAGGSYFERTGTPSPLLHTWSLAVEEQFYLVWPVVVALLARRGGRRAVGIVAGAGVVASALSMALLAEPGGDSSRAYYGTDARVHVILMGALLAVVLDRARHRDQPSPLARTALVGGAALAVVGLGAAMAVATGGTTWLYLGGFAGVAAATAAVIAAAVLLPRDPIARALAVPPLPALGRISYGVYLWHWPIYLGMTGARTHLTGTPLLVARIAATVGVSALSAWLVERPIRTGRALGGRWGAAAIPATAAAAAALLFAAAVWLPLATDRAPRLAARTTAAPEGGAPIPVPVRPGRSAGVPAKVMFIGDSVSLTIGDGIAPLGPRYGMKIANEGLLGCGVARGGPLRYFGDKIPSPPECERWPARWQARVEREDPDVVVVVIGRWEVMDRVHGGSWTQIGDPTFDAYLASEIDTALEIVTARGARVALATAPYYLRGERPDGGRWPEDDPARVDRFNVLVREAAARHRDSTTVVELNAKTSVEGRYARSIDGLQVRYDGVHFTPQGSRWLAPWLLPQVAALAPAAGAAGAAGAASTTTAATSTSTTSLPGPSTTRRQGSTTTEPVAPGTTRPRPTTSRPAASTTTTEPSTTTTRVKPLDPLP